MTLKKILSVINNMFFGFVKFVVFIPNVNNHYVFTE
jgi:hypothetical protein